MVYTLLGIALALALIAALILGVKESPVILAAIVTSGLGFGEDVRIVVELQGGDPSFDDHTVA